MRGDYLNTVYFIERDKINRITLLEFYFPEEDCDLEELPKEQRLSCGHIEVDYNSNKAKFFDGSMGCEIFDNGKSTTIVLNEDHGSRQVTGGLPQWVQEQFVNHLEYKARVFCRDFFTDYKCAHPNDWSTDACISNQLKSKFELYDRGMELLQKERGKAFAADEEDSYLAFWAMGRIFLDNYNDDILQVFYCNMPKVYEQVQNDLDLIEKIIGHKISKDFLSSLKELGD